MKEREWADFAGKTIQKPAMEKKDAV